MTNAPIQESLRNGAGRGPVTIRVAGRSFPPTLSTAETAELWGCAPETLYAQLGAGTLPVEPLALGRRYRWSTVQVAQALGLPVEIVHAAAGDADQPLTMGGPER